MNRYINLIRATRVYLEQRQEAIGSTLELCLEQDREEWTYLQGIIIGLQQMELKCLNEEFYTSIGHYKWHQTGMYQFCDSDELYGVELFVKEENDYE